ncbi:MAG: endolytic transglycosylase MltG [Firmicutes bacterium]|nr:endolytic transglycosylase MltG [Bacillota bacterium]
MKKKRRLKKKPIIILVVCLVFIVGLTMFVNSFRAVSKESVPVLIEVTEGQNYYSLASTLKEKGLIRSTFSYKLYLKTQNLSPLKKGNYHLNKNMDLKTLLHSLAGDEKFNTGEIDILFKEGKNMRQIAKIIADNTNHTEEEVFSLLRDETYLNSLIQTYWFLTDEIKNPSIYYSLEGYLLPDTYRFASMDVEVKDIFKKMLDNMDKKLAPYQQQIEASPYSFHQLLTVASMAELEASTVSDRAAVARVFYNRFNSKMALGSDVTTYYGAKINLGERDLYMKEIQEANAYNTRSVKSAGKLPVGPISNPGIATIAACINPPANNYYYFVADKNKKVYFNVTSKQHDATIADLKKKGLWFTW